MISALDKSYTTTIIGNIDGSMTIKRGAENIKKVISEAPLTAIKILNETTFICGDFNGNLNLINITDETSKRTINCTDSITDLSVNKQSIFVLTTDSLKVININNFVIEKDLKISGGLNVSCNEKYLVVSFGTHVSLYDNNLKIIKEFKGERGIIASENVFNIFCLIVSEKNVLKFYQQIGEEFVCSEKELNENIENICISKVGFCVIVEVKSGIKGFVFKDNEICEVPIQ